jgi:hypothetical protein
VHGSTTAMLLVVSGNSYMSLGIPSTMVPKEFLLDLPACDISFAMMTQMMFPFLLLLIAGYFSQVWLVILSACTGSTINASLLSWQT